MKANYKIVTGNLENIPVNITRFPTGEVAVKLDDPEDYLHRSKGRVTIEVQGYEPDTFFILANIKDALDVACQYFSIKNVEKQLVIYYMPNARYDRHMVDGDGFALRVFCEMINLLKFDRVVVVDPHSDITYSLLKNCVVVDQCAIMMDINDKFNLNHVDFLVAPDAGAQKKIFKFAEQIGLPVVTMNKVRDVKTGKITHTEAPSKIQEGACYLIVDDICDGGYTFIKAAEALKHAGAGQVDLAVTHGIFSKGLDVLLDGNISNVYTTNTYSDLPERINLHQLKYFKK